LSDQLLRECAGGVVLERERRVRGAEGRILGEGLRWLAETEVSSAKTDVRQSKISINRLNYKAPEVYHATDELTGYIICATKFSNIKFVIPRHNLLLHYKYRLVREVTAVYSASNTKFLNSI
jgi:hypothetical protein